MVVNEGLLLFSHEFVALPSWSTHLGQASSPSQRDLDVLSHLEKL
jgi:hypothetical protein